MNLRLFPLIKFYPNDRPCILMFDNPSLQGTPFGKLSTNLPEASINENEILVKNYAENQSWAMQYIKENPHFFFNTATYINNGFADFPIYRLTPLFINLQFERTYCKGEDIYHADTQLFYLHTKYALTHVQDKSSPT